MLDILEDCNFDDFEERLETAAELDNELKLALAEDGIDFDAIMIVDNFLMSCGELQI